MEDLYAKNKLLMRKLFHKTPYSYTANTKLKEKELYSIIKEISPALRMSKISQLKEKVVSEPIVESADTLKEALSVNETRIQKRIEDKKNNYSHSKWKLYRVISGHNGWVKCVDVDPQNQWFVTGSEDRLIKFWDLASGKLKLSLAGHVHAVNRVKVSKRHPYLFSAGEDNSVKCWDLEQNKVVRHYHGHLSGLLLNRCHGFGITPNVGHYCEWWTG